MKRLLLILLLCASPSWAAIAVAFHPAGVTNSSASTTCAITTTIGSGNVTIMSVALPTGVVVTGVTDNKSGGTNTYTIERMIYSPTIIGDIKSKWQAYIVNFYQRRKSEIVWILIVRIIISRR